MITFKQLLILLLCICILHYLFENIEYFTARDPVLDELRTQLSVLDPSFSNIELFEGDKSYTVNKKKVYICLKDQNGRYYNRNMLAYVTIHELAHMLCTSVGHTKEFFDIFDDLLSKAADLGLYNPSIPPLDDYCGH